MRRYGTVFQFQLLLFTRITRNHSFISTVLRYFVVVVAVASSVVFLNFFLPICIPAAVTLVIIDAINVFYLFFNVQLAKMSLNSTACLFYCNFSNNKNNITIQLEHEFKMRRLKINFAKKEKQQPIKYYKLETLFIFRSHVSQFISFDDEIIQLFFCFSVLHHFVHLDF